ncbi:DMT family transporter [Thermoflavimicrobium daqui]|uniref:QacE family quaternary ammonium compound efflux SMR transporter n=1 Tax=Thermoflavimicrobium daqui TaxID=2137476 RepID=A0A364K4A0_9BACL|nr:multidrug efflux SMR transporter [Thermoflavimicrobium daqui]RAL24204.1 QacE family quaternary ammonium compound efflux SMR transporter [Thermoflavimicrobium daqui]
MKGYIALGISIMSEVFGTTMLKMSEGLTKPFPSIGVIIGFGLSFYCLSLCLQTVPLSLAYAIWSGVGTALTALIGILLWEDPFNFMTFAGLILIIGGVFLLNFSNRTGKGANSSN